MQLLNSFLLFLASSYAGADETPNLRGNPVADKDAHENGTRMEDDGENANRRLLEVGGCFPRECQARMNDNICDEACNTQKCYWDGGDCNSRADNFVRLTLGTSNVHRYAYSGMDAEFTIYDTRGKEYSFNIEKYDPLPDVGESWTYSIYTPRGFGTVNKDKIKIEATNNDGWCFDLVEIDRTRMNLEATCEGGSCDKNALWLDELTWRERSTSYAFKGNYGKAESWTLYSYRRPRKN